MRTPQRSRRISLFFAASVAFAGCDSDSDEPGDDGSATEDDGGADDTAPGEDDAMADGQEDDGAPADESGDESGGAGGFAADVAPILAANCSCHTGGMPTAGLDLNEGAAFGALVDVMSSAGIPFVTSGDSSASYLVNKLDGSQVDAGGSGGQMPPSGALAPGDIDTIVEWIDAGALP